MGREVRTELARRSLLDFLRETWRYPFPFHAGNHTRAICNRFTRAVEDFKEGVSSYFLVLVPQRHGKSEIVSRAFPPYFIGACQDVDPTVLVAAYGKGLTEGFSKDAKSIVRSDAYRDIFPTAQIARGSDNVYEWNLEGSTGRVNYTGLGGTVIGKGANFLGIDDYCKSRAEARSKTLRDKTWDAFRVDLMSRLDDVHIVAITATPWHVDDLSGRLRKLMLEDPDFPRFETLKFPAGGVDGPYLFPEKYSEKWYRIQYASQGRLAAANLDCNPQLEGGNRFEVDKIVYHDSLDDFPKARYVRAWDLASSSKQRSKDDPDSTVGVLAHVRKLGPASHELWVRDAVACQEEAPTRDRLIRKTAVDDGPASPIHVESFAGYKDAFTTLRSVLKGQRSVRKSTLPGDKGVKASPLEQVFEAGNVHVLRGRWNAEFERQFREFPDGDHDDYVDATVVAFHAQTSSGSNIIEVR